MTLICPVFNLILMFQNVLQKHNILKSFKVRFASLISDPIFGDTEIPVKLIHWLV